MNTPAAPSAASPATPSPTAPTAPAPSPGSGWVARAGLVAALVALAAIVLLPAAQGLPVAGQVMLGILAFAVIVWMTEALDYAVSAVVIGALMIFLLAFRPPWAKLRATWAPRRH